MDAFIMPTGSDPISGGDDAITTNAQITAAELTRLDGLTSTLATTTAETAETVTALEDTAATTYTAYLPGVGISIAGQDKRRTALETREDDGALSDFSLDLTIPHLAPRLGMVSRPDLSTITVADEAQRVLLQWDESTGALIYPTPATGAGGSTGPEYPAASILMATDSMGLGWNTHLADFTALPVVSVAHGGQTSAQISARVGGVRALMSVAGAQIPASGSVQVTEWTVNPVYGASAFPRQGTLAGVQGQLDYDKTAATGTASNGTMTFTRTTAGATVAAPRWSEFVCTEEQYTDRVGVLWAYHNDTPLSVGATVTHLKAMREKLTARVKRCLILEACPNAAWTTGTAGRALFDERRAAVTAAFPEIVPVYTWLLTDDAALTAGVTLTADDRTDIANGIVPRSLRGDAIHLTDAAKNAVAWYVAAAMHDRGWIPVRPAQPNH